MPTPRHPFALIEPSGHVFSRGDFCNYREAAAGLILTDAMAGAGWGVIQTDLPTFPTTSLT